MRVVNKVDGVLTFDNGDPARDEYVPPDVINVRQAGAVGDGVTDDTAILQACLDAGPCYFPPGAYLVTVTVKPALTIT